MQSPVLRRASQMAEERIAEGKATTDDIITVALGELGLLFRRWSIVTAVMAAMMALLTIAVSTTLALSLAGGEGRAGVDFHPAAGPRAPLPAIEIIDERGGGAVALQELEAIAVAVFGDQADVMLRIAKCESGHNPNAHNPNGENSRGLWQINVEAHPWAAALDLWDPYTNAIVASIILEQQGLSAWFNCATALGLL